MKYHLLECWEYASWGGSDSCSYTAHYEHSYYSSIQEAKQRFEVLTESPDEYKLNSSNLVSVHIIEEESNKFLKSWGM